MKTYFNLREWIMGARKASKMQDTVKGWGNNKEEQNEKHNIRRGINSILGFIKKETSWVGKVTLTEWNKKYQKKCMESENTNEKEVRVPRLTWDKVIHEILQKKGKENVG